MDINEIKKLIKVFESSVITELTVQEGNLKIKISKNGSVNTPIYTTQNIPIQNQMVSSSVTESSSSSQVSETSKGKEDNFHVIKSPIVGTFYRAPAPDADPYVQVGEIVNPGSVLCIVEAMKLMNEIECDIDGKIVQILVEDGTPVEYNQPLFKIEKS
ncbi:MAG: acetyl-CoA carboxylase biotin carboxyl carrier protein [Ignavibacteriales bacterium]|jgi:acetyl-CoA carboxylase biotin carboxyl carrier protein|nr:acetyl-CoA carboxylase biotin carboxyl carrier protein [Ignavibacteriales bacterium]MBK7981610.1 acetyl-CoA carboxylase biotin carboxyl carrier protein [Ignavibacteriota bacterium]